MKRDPALLFFAVGALFCLIVSVPATGTAMQLFHGQWWGVLATAVFEVGAVGSELATLAIPQWRKRLLALTIILLLATTGANYALGADEFAKAALPATYEGIRAGGYGWLLSIVASALFPALLFVFLTATTARYRMLTSGEDWRGMRQRLSDTGALVESLSAELAQARHMLEQRGALVTEELIVVARRELSVRHLAKLVGAPESTLRRKLAQIEEESTV